MKLYSCNYNSSLTIEQWMFASKIMRKDNWILKINLAGIFRQLEKHDRATDKIYKFPYNLSGQPVHQIPQSLLHVFPAWRNTFVRDLSSSKRSRAKKVVSVVYLSVCADKFNCKLIDTFNCETFSIKTKLRPLCHSISFINFYSSNFLASRVATAKRTDTHIHIHRYGFSKMHFP